MNGMCVDVTLTDKEGNEIEMPSSFDAMDERAALNYSGHSENGRRNGEYLKQVMESVGFRHMNVNGSIFMMYLQTRRRFRIMK